MPDKVEKQRKSKRKDKIKNRNVNINWGMNLLKRIKVDLLEIIENKKANLKKYIINCMKMTGIKISIVTILALGFSTAFFFNSVYALAGSGTAKDPYIVSIEDELRDVLLTKFTKSWVYVGVKKSITITRNIAISKGKFKIYAYDSNVTLKRTSDGEKSINGGEYPKYCMTLSGTAEIDMGVTVIKSKTLTLGGNKSNFSTKKRSSGWLYLKSGTKATINSNCVVKNVMNNKEEDGGSAICTFGTLILNGTIENCEGSDGGAIGVKKGSITINNNAVINQCKSYTEGGGIFGMDGCTIKINGGTISNCVAEEEGGAIFVSGSSNCTVENGTIKQNSAGLSGGAIFSGYGANLTIGKNGKGPLISSNNAKGNGGAIRCNGGSGKNAGGETKIYGGTISNNLTKDNGGGISCGNGGSSGSSKIIIKNTNISQNESVNDGGAINFPSKLVGIDNDYVEITDSVIDNNYAQGKGGGLVVANKVIFSKNTLSNNEGVKSGGGIHINNGDVTFKSGEIYGNKTGNNGQGIYVNGLLKIKGSIYFNDNNNVYLKKNKYVEITGSLSRKSGFIAKINSEEEAPGTKIIKVGYGNKKGSDELYYANGEEKYTCTSNGSSKILRPTDEVSGYEDNWIIISRQYSIRYEKNCQDIVTGMPNSQHKYWNENINLSTKNVERAGYELNTQKHWNTSENGNGIKYSPGSIYSGNADLTLHAIWEKITVKEIYITTTDRYYVVGQKIVLNKDEILKKVKVDDDLHTGYKYVLKVVSIKERNMDTALVTGNDIQAENYLNTNEIKGYTIKIVTNSADKKVTAYGTMKVYVLNTDLSGQRVRFISEKYIGTLDANSKWSRSLSGKLQDSIKRTNSSQAKYYIEISDSKRNNIRDKVKENNYKNSENLTSIIKGKLGL